MKRTDKKTGREMQGMGIERRMKRACIHVEREVSTSKPIRMIVLKETGRDKKKTPEGAILKNTSRRIDSAQAARKPASAGCKRLAITGQE